MGQRFTPEQWARWIEEFDAIGLTVKEFCAQKQVSENSFYQWRRRIDRDPPSTRDRPFVSVAIAADDDVKIQLPCGATISVANDPGAIRPVLVALPAAGLLLALDSYEGLLSQWD
ncbi:IS66 family insertion sequence element accessory protein TnpA [Roseiconus lacunae]|uniref:IS66 family insertion sequence element accessory protein TnpA n=1 Tax=Roseiconus lacunae TaxID=2605694 RepID=UPI001E4BFB5F|nr:transposase [Roseiconus lacunae]MCD0458166.1 transposase [Roseiconus lacunae]